MHGRAAKRLLSGLVALGAATAFAAAAEAQDTTQTQTTPSAQDTSATSQAGADTMGTDSTKWGYPVDTSGAQNPPGYRGMERPSGLPDSAGDSVSAGQVEDRATGTYDDSTWQDTTRGEQNPAGYRGMERPAADSATGDTSMTDTSATDTSASGMGANRDTTEVGQEQTYTPEKPEARMQADTSQPGAGRTEPTDSQ